MMNLLRGCRLYSKNQPALHETTTVSCFSSIFIFFQNLGKQKKVPTEDVPGLNGKWAQEAPRYRHIGRGACFVVTYGHSITCPDMPPHHSALFEPYCRSIRRRNPRLLSNAGVLANYDTHVALQCSACSSNVLDGHLHTNNVCSFSITTVGSVG